MKIYIAGPMTGIPLYNFPAFDRYAEHVRKHGHEAVNPADLDRAQGFDPKDLPEDHNWASVPDGISVYRSITNDIGALLGCAVVHCLPGWQKSKGATAEVAVANWRGIPIRDAMGPLAQVVMDTHADLHRKGSKATHTPPPLFPSDAAGRKQVPVCTGLLMYFPHACARVAKLSSAGNEQHNPGEPLHWAQEKSIGDGNEITRHVMEGLLEHREGNHDAAEEALASAAWRGLELLERLLCGMAPFKGSE